MANRLIVYDISMYRSPYLISAAIVISIPIQAMADVGARVAPNNAWNSWNFDPLVILTLCVAGWLYGRGFQRLRQRGRQTNSVKRFHRFCYYVGLTVIGVALLSPLDGLSQELSAIHMAQHMLLTIVAAPLLVIGSPYRVIAHALPPLWRELIGFQWLAHRAAWHPFGIWAVFASVTWVWHHPHLYQAALRDPVVHDAQHLTFFTAAFLFWRVVLDPFSHRRLQPLAAAAFLFATSIHTSALGIFLALAPSPWYLYYAERTADFGLSPLADQQLAGLLMWMPGCLIYPAVAAGRLAYWLNHTAAETRLTGYPS